MNLLILPGFSPENLVWAKQISAHLSAQFEAKVHIWKHWETGNIADFSPESELDLIHTQLENSGTSCVIAKSIGTFVLAHGIPSSKSFIKKIILCGIPILDIPNDERGVYKNYQLMPKTDIVCLQNTNDPHGSLTDITTLFESEKLDIPLQSFEANTHEYPYFTEMLNFLTN